MKYVWKLVGFITCCFLLVACNPQTDNVNLNKEGTEYSIDNVRFYYPDRYELEEKGTENTRVQFQSEEEYIFYEVHVDETDNELDHRKELYTGELQLEGANNIVVSQPNLRTGLSVYEITGSFIDENLRFKHIVYFTESHTYIYGYMATSEGYEENIKEITAFLKSIVIEEILED